MQLRDVMTKDVEAISADATLEEAARKMKELDVGPLPVVDDGTVIGVITDRDITVRATAHGSDPKTSRVRDAMTSDVVSCFEDEGVEAAARVMSEKQIRRLLVLTREKKLVGIVSLGDLAIEAGDDLAGEVLEDVSQPSQPT